MVKGITRQVILVKSPDPRLFEEAIFIVKEEALAREGVSAERVLKEARQAADGYLKQGKAWNRRLERLPVAAWAGAGAAAAAVSRLGVRVSSGVILGSDMVILSFSLYFVPYFSQAGFPARGTPHP